MHTANRFAAFSDCRARYIGKQVGNPCENWSTSSVCQPAGWGGVAWLEEEGSCFSHKQSYGCHYRTLQSLRPSRRRLAHVTQVPLYPVKPKEQEAFFLLSSEPGVECSLSLLCQRPSGMVFAEALAIVISALGPLGRNDGGLWDDEGRKLRGVDTQGGKPCR